MYGLFSNNLLLILVRFVEDLQTLLITDELFSHFPPTKCTLEGVTWQITQKSLKINVD
jgi:hypothetical protein